MFGRLSTIPQFVDDSSEVIFKNIRGNAFDDDKIIVATLRSLLFNRLNKNENFNFYYNYFGCTSGIYSCSINEILEGYFHIHDANSLNFISISSVDDNQYLKLCQKIRNPESGILSVTDCLEELKDIEQYFYDKYHITVCIYIEKSINYAVVMTKTEQVSVPMSQVIATFIPRYLPSLFADNPLTEDEKQMLFSLTKRSSTDFLNRMSVLAEKLDIRKHKIMCQLSDFEKKARQAMLDNERAKLSNIHSEMTHIMDQYARYCMDFDASNIRIEGLKALINKTTDNDETVQYFIANKCIDLLSVVNRKLTFIIRTYLDTYNADAFERFAKEGDIYKYYNNMPDIFANEENRKLLLDNIFSESPLLHIKMCGYYSIDLSGIVNSQSNYPYDSQYQDYLPNPHLQRHNCLGDNRRYIQNEIQRGNVIGAVQCCIASAGSVNVLETDITFKPMLNEMFRSQHKILETIDGSQQFTPEEALVWLQERKEKEEQK